MIMNKNNYKQYDTRWAKLGYPKSPYFIRDCGCGEVAVCNCIIEMTKYENETPKTIQPYCKQFAEPHGNGTYFSGIPTMMKHYGMTEVKEHATMDSLWKELAKGDRVAIYLMGNRKGGSNKVHWTSSAHFVCSVGYRKNGSKHEVYVKDSYSTSSQRNGWISYEGNMRNDVSRVWSGKLAKAEPKKSVDEIAKEVLDGKWGNGDERVKRLKEAGYDPSAVQKRVNELLAPKKSIDVLAQEVINGEWGSGDERKKRLTDAGYDYDAVQKKVNEILAVKNKIGACANEYAYTTNSSKASYKTGEPTTAYKKGLDKAYPDRSKWGTASRKGASCDVFVGTCIRNTGVDKDFPRGLAEQIPYLEKSAKFKQVSVTPSTAKDGDIIVYTKTKGGGHICIVHGGKIKEAGHENYYPKTTDTLKARLSKTDKNWVKVYRVVEESWVDKANKWAKKIAVDNNFHYVKWKSKDTKTHECPICHNHAKGKYYGWNCIGFSFAVWHHGGGLPCKCSDGVIANEIWEKILNAKTDAEALALAQKHVGLKELKVIRNKNGIPKSQWKAGDIMGKFNGNKYIHTFYYMGGGKIAESTGSSGKVPVNEQIRIKSYDKASAKVIVRYTGK